MQQHNQKPKIWQCAVLCVAAFALLIIIGLTLNSKLGFYSTPVTQLMLITLAIAFVLINKGKIKDAFIFEKPTIRKTFGALTMYVGTYMIIMCVTMLIAYLFPEEYFALSENMLYTFTDGVSPTVAFIIISLTPAICEEFFFRGALSYGLRGLKPYIIVLAIGIIFGIFHTNIIRFFPTAILGMLFTYVYLKSNNMLYPMMLHFINNAISSLSMLSTDTSYITSEAQTSILLSSVGVIFIMCAAAPFVLNLGNNLLEPKKLTYYNPYEKDEKRTKKNRIIVISSVCLALIGFLMISADISNREEILNIDKSVSIQSDTSIVDTIEFTNEEYNIYTLSYDIKAQSGLVQIILEDEEGNVYIDDNCHEESFAYSVALEGGKYNVIIISHIDDVWDYIKEKGLNYTKDGDLITLNMGYDTLDEYELRYKVLIY